MILAISIFLLLSGSSFNWAFLSKKTPANDYQTINFYEIKNYVNEVQNPKNCDCFWQDTKNVMDATNGNLPPAGSMPIEPFINQ